MQPFRLVPLLLLAATQGQNCQATLGPEGLCANLQLSPSQGQLRVGETLLVRVNGDLTCGNNRQPAALRWRSTSPKIASVDSAGLVRALVPGQVKIEVLVTATQTTPSTGMQVVVIP